MNLKKSMLALLLFMGMNSSFSQDFIKGSILISQEKPLYRFRARKQLTPDIDFYFVSEIRDYNITKARLQYFPLEIGPLRAGISTYAQMNEGEIKKDVGVGTRTEGNITKNLYSWNELSYYLLENKLNGKFVLKYKNSLSFDLLLNFNTSNKSAMFRPGLDYIINKNLSLGIEARYKGVINNIKKEYFGVRVNFKYK